MILTFHEIVDQPSSDLYQLSTERFEAYLRTIQELSAPSGRDTPCVQVTFDDGHISHYRLALPLLARYRIRAVFFVTVGMTGVEPQYMSWEQLAELVAAKHEVQAHSWSHPFLPDLPQSAIEEELLRSRETLEERLAVPVRKLAIPFGRYTARVLQACAPTGYEQVYTSDPWIGSKRHAGIQVWGRLSVRSTLSPGELRSLLTLRSFPYLCRRTKSETKEAVKKLLGDRLYRSVWLNRARKVPPILPANYVLAGVILWQTLDLLLTA